MPILEYFWNNSEIGYSILKIDNFRIAIMELFRNYYSRHSGLAWGCRIFEKIDFLVDMGSFNIQTNIKRETFNFSKKIVQKN
jgi:hypothetical protein